jgi:hypothetical protein
VACLSPIGQPPNHTSTRPHSIKTLPPDLTRAKAGRPPTRIHVPTHTSWQHPATNPCCYRAYRHTVPSSSPATHSLAALTTGLFCPLSNGRTHGEAHMGHGPWTTDRGSWDMARCVAVTQPPASTPARRLSLPFPTRSQVESTASHDHLNVSIRPEFRAEEAAVEHWYRAYWKAKRLPA